MPRPRSSDGLIAVHSSAVFLTEFGAIILGLGLLGRFAARFRFSPIPLYLLAGLAFGEGGLLPLNTSEEFVATGAEIGVILLLLMLGLEYTASDLVSNLKTQYPAGLVDMAFNALPGAAMALLLGWGPIAAVVLAGVTWVSSSGVIAKVLGDLGRLGNRETPVILSILVLEDLSMAVYLPIITALLAGTGLAAGGITLAIALGVAGLVLLLAVRYGRHISRFVSNEDPEKLLLVVLGLTLLVAGWPSNSRSPPPSARSSSVSRCPARSPRGRTTCWRRCGICSPRVLRLLRTAHRSVQHSTGAAARARPGRRHRTHEDRHRILGREASRNLRQGPLRAGGTLVARGEFSIVIAGLAVTAGIEPSLGPLATAYVLILVILGPLTARYTEPVALRLTARLARSAPRDRTPAEVPAAREELRETVGGQDTAGRR